MSKEKNSDQSSQGLGKNALEWSVFAVSLLLVGATLFYLGREISQDQKAPPHIALQLGKPRILQGTNEPRFIVPVKALNKGGKTAEGVHIEVQMQGKGRKQSADYDIDFLPRGSSREGWVVFDGQPENARLDARVLGYEIP